MDKVTIEKLPYGKDMDGAKRWDEEKGEFVQISYREEARHIAFFEIKKGFFRGSHYHARKEEVFYVLRGKIQAVFMDMDTLEREERVLKKGDKIRVQTRCGHIFYGMEDTHVVEYSPQVYDKEDTYSVIFDEKQGVWNRQLLLTVYSLPVDFTEV